MKQYFYFTPEQRKAVIQWLTPKAILYLPVLAIATGTSGWVMANWDGYLKATNPEQYWIYAALIIITILTVRGFGFILPIEELLFRGFFLRKLASRIEFWRANLVTTIMFLAIHYPLWFFRQRAALLIDCMECSRVLIRSFGEEGS